MRDAYETLHNGVSETLQVPSEYDATVRANISDTPPQPLSKTPGNAVGDDLSASISGAVATDEYGFGQRKRPEGAMSARQAGHFGGIQSEK